MEEENRIYAENNQISENSMSADEAFAAQIEQRRRARDKKRLAKKRRTVILLIIILALLMTMCGREIVRLKAENIALKKQQKELEEEREKLNEELKKSRDRDYVEEKARDQLRLLNDGEILFLFDDDSSADKSKETEKKDE
ncbi:MAG: septum formation initiator family protein [Mogibacterium sp.]|nr:septum formation initiator family protein [Mogibacterium sp.]